MSGISSAVCTSASRRNLAHEGHCVSIGRVVLFLLVGIHWILPFTPVNPHEEARIVIASVVLGAAFLTLALRSYRHPTRSFALAGALVTVVIG